MPRERTATLWTSLRVRARDFVHDQTFVPMAIAAALGAWLLYRAVDAFAARCWVPKPTAQCLAIIASPPWPLLTAIVAGPAALLTWYWRTAHKKRDIEDANRAQIAVRFATAVELIDKGGLTTIGAIYALEQIARDSPKDHWTVVETLAAFVRNAGNADRPKGDRQAQVQAAISVIGRRNTRHDGEGGVVDLRAAPLLGINFDDLDFAGANFDHAKANEATFFGTNLAGAKLDLVMGLWTKDDEYFEGQYAGEGEITPGRYNNRTRGEAERAVLARRWLKNEDEPAEPKVAAPAVEEADDGS